ncbi:hypothetical protein JKP88DRAFT_240866 [Tribonema minus]|uniref:Uncharacterized protein n=1 Tax=Tribonema minus TaxID=303371 RepID=A0A835Z2C8_9STRA|nr:hypothetical protein JKP88DRAFT_240866 [Tribonema minus]
MSASRTRQDLANEVLNRETPFEKAERLFVDLCKECESIEYGLHWKSDKTFDKVCHQQRLDLAGVATAIAAADADVEAQWRLAIVFARYLGSVISEAYDCAPKLAGAFCLSAAAAVADVWPPLVKAGSKVPPRALIEKALGASDFAGDCEGDVCVRQLLTEFWRVLTPLLLPKRATPVALLM